MSRKEQLDEIETWVQVLEQVRQLLLSNAVSSPLDSHQRTERLVRVEKLRVAVERVKESVKLSSPIAMQPSADTAAIMKKLDAKVTQEVIGGMRLLHQSWLVFADKIAVYEQETREKQIAVDFTRAKKRLDDVIQCYKRLGSRKLHEENLPLLQERLAESDMLREKMAVDFKKIFNQVRAAEGVNHGG